MLCGCPLLDCVFDVGHLAGPEAAILGGPPVVDHLDRHRIVIEPALSAFLFRDQELAVFELPEMVHHRDPGGVELAGDLPNGAARRMPDQVEDPPPGGIPKGIEDRRHVIHR